MLEYSLFHKLPPWTQAELLEQKGVVLASRSFKDWSITLYAYDHRFLEVWSRKGVELVTSFKPTASYMDIIEPYLHEWDALENS